METKVLPFGTRVRLSDVDMHGYCGRDLHPHEDDIGFLGVVIQNVVWRTDSEGYVDCTDTGVAPGTILRQDDAFGLDDESVMEEAMYTVLAPDGRKLECMWFELEVIGSVVTS